MVLKLLEYATVQKGLRELGNAAYSMVENLITRVKTPVLEDRKDLWKDTVLNSKTINLSGGVNQDNRCCFRIDHDFDLSKIVNSSINEDTFGIDETYVDRYIPIDKDTYKQSEGTEFIIIGKSDIEGAKGDYAIRADKYEGIRKQLNERGYNLSDLKEAGGFRINDWLTQDEIPTGDGWLELAVGKNKASEKDYEEASKFLKEKYIPKAEEKGCFSRGAGMSFVIRIGEDGYKARPWFVSGSYFRSDAVGGGNFKDGGCFLSVLDESAAGPPAKK